MTISLTTKVTTPSIIPLTKTLTSTTLITQTRTPVTVLFSAQNKTSSTSPHTTWNRTPTTSPLTSQARTHTTTPLTTLAVNQISTNRNTAPSNHQSKYIYFFFSLLIFPIFILLCYINHLRKKTKRIPLPDVSKMNAYTCQYNEIVKIPVRTILTKKNL